MENNQTNIKLRKDGLWEARYKKGRNKAGKIVYASCYGKTREAAISKRAAIFDQRLIEANEPKGLQLLILGAGSHGQEVREIAESLRCFTKIDFLDDDLNIPGVIGSWDKVVELASEYAAAIVAVGDENKRRLWSSKLANIGYFIPTLVHRSAIVSPNAVLEAGTVVCARATISSGAHIGKGCIISAGVTVGRVALVEDWTHIDIGGVVRKRIFDKNNYVTVYKDVE